jgi:hypothetical protein
MLSENRNYALKNGLFLGICYCLTALFFYFFDVHMLFEGSYYFYTVFGVLFLLFPIILIIKSELDLSTFKDCFSVVFLGLACAISVYTLFLWILHNLMGPELYVELVTLYENPAQETTDQDILNNLKFKHQIDPYVGNLLSCISYSAVVALIKTFKHKK